MNHRLLRVEITENVLHGATGCPVPEASQERARSLRIVGNSMLARAHHTKHALVNRRIDWRDCRQEGDPMSGICKPNRT